MISTKLRDVVISGSSSFTPPEKISNTELVAVFNEYVDLFNEENIGAIETGHLAKRDYSSAEKIKNETGIESRYVVTRNGITDPDTMMPLLPKRDDNQLCLQAELATYAGMQALEKAQISVNEIDLIIVASSHFERSCPAIAIEVQRALNSSIKATQHKPSLAFDLNLGAAGMVAAMSLAKDMIVANSINRALVISAEIGSGYINFRDIKSHFLSGDAASAIVIEALDCIKPGKEPKRLIQIEAQQSFSTYDNYQRNNFGFLNRCHPDSQYAPDKLLIIKAIDSMPLHKLVLDFLSVFFEKNNIKAEHIKQYWLQQTNSVTNNKIMDGLFPLSLNKNIYPQIMNTYGNTESAGVGIAFDQFHQDLILGDRGIFCAFGSGLSVASILVKVIEI